MTMLTPGTAAEPRLLVCDTFSDDRRMGKVLGSEGPEGSTRGGADVEGVLSIDHGALRIGMLASPGWGRAGVAYGPFRREPGLAMSALVLNGLNASSSYQQPKVHRRIARWMLGVPGVDPPSVRVWRWPGPLKRETALRRVACWGKRRQRAGAFEPLSEDLAAGLFP